MSEIKLVGQIVKEYLEKFPNTSSLSLARIIYRDNKEVFTDTEHARGRVRYYRGASGPANKKGLTDRKYVREFIPYSSKP